MPTYEYRCRKCGHEFEQFQKITDPPLSECPVCSGSVERLITTGGGFILKGRGFYATDYAQGRGATRCGREQPCCGKDTPCEVKPCDD